jgi:hypothetical protein
MIMNFPNSTELLRHSLKEALYSKLVAQLAKDFVLANIPFEIAQDIAPNDLKIMLHEKIYFLIMEKFSEYLNLLYIVDVPEKAIREIEVTDVVEVAEQVSFLILQRELQKVWLKTRYS